MENTPLIFGLLALAATPISAESALPLAYASPKTHYASYLTAQPSRPIQQAVPQDVINVPMPQPAAPDSHQFPTGNDSPQYPFISPVPPGPPVHLGPAPPAPKSLKAIKKKRKREREAKRNRKVIDLENCQTVMVPCKVRETVLRTVFIEVPILKQRIVKREVLRWVEKKVPISCYDPRRCCHVTTYRIEKHLEPTLCEEIEEYWDTEMLPRKKPVVVEKTIYKPVAVVCVD